MLGRLNCSIAREILNVNYEFLHLLEVSQVLECSSEVFEAGFEDKREYIDINMLVSEGNVVRHVQAQTFQLWISCEESQIDLFERIVSKVQGERFIREMQAIDVSQFISG